MKNLDNNAENDQNFENDNEISENEEDMADLLQCLDSDSQ